MSMMAGLTLMLERVQQFTAMDHIQRILFIEEQVRRHQDPQIRAYVGMFWGRVYNLIGESHD